MKASSAARRGVAASAVLVAGLALSGCGAPRPDAAAVVDGRVITQDSLRQVLDQAATAKPQPQQQKLDQQHALFFLMAYPYVMDQLKAKNAMVSPQESVAKVFQGVTNPSPALGQVAQVWYGAGRLDQAAQQKIFEEMGRAHIEVNPRYGTFDTQKGFQPVAPNWMVAGSTATAAPNAPADPNAPATP